MPGFKVGDGQGLLERKRGWMLFSRKGLYSQVELGFETGFVVGESIRVDDGEGSGRTVLSRESGVGALRRELDMLRMLVLPRRGRAGGVLSVGDGGECVHVVSMEVFLVSDFSYGQSVASE